MLKNKYKFKTQLYFFITFFMLTYVNPSKDLTTVVKFGKATYAWLFIVFLYEAVKYLKKEGILKLFNQFYKHLILDDEIKLLIVLFASGLLSFNFNSMKNSLMVIFTYIVFTVTFQLISYNHNIKSKLIFEWYMQAFVIFSIVSSAIGIWTLFVGNIALYPFFGVYQRKSYRRMYGWFGNPNRISAFIAISFLMNFYFIKTSKQRNIKIKRILLSLFLLISLFLTDSRSSILSLLIVYSLKFFSKIITSNFWGNHKRKLFFSVLFITFIVFLSSLSFTRGINLNGRFLIWAEALELVKARPIYRFVIGNGHGYFSRTMGFSTHNGYIRWLIEYGFIFIIMFCYYSYQKICLLKTKRIIPFYDLILSLFLFLLLRELATQSLYSMRYEYQLYIYIGGLIKTKD